MFGRLKIKEIRGREILDSRGNPTIEAKVILNNGLIGRAAVPSGASTGSHEALELRDNDPKRYQGKGVLKAVRNIDTIINDLLVGEKVTNQTKIDEMMIEKDGRENKSRLGANAILGVSLAAARAATKALGLPLYRYLREVYKINYSDYQLPLATMNILNGGRHADWSLDLQECMIIPKSRLFKDRVRMGAEIFHSLGKILKERGYSILVGDEGGYAAKLKNNEEAFELISEAVKAAGYQLKKDVNLGIDAAASEFYDEETKKYNLRSDNKSLTATELIDQYDQWLNRYPLVLVEDGLAEDDWDNWKILTEKEGKNTLLVGDDLFVTNLKRLKKGIKMKVANAILIKLNQIGTLTETMQTIYSAKKKNYKIIISHRSGETCDTTIADLAVAVNADYIKTGSLSRSERINKYNRLMAIEQELAEEV